MSFANLLHCRSAILALVAWASPVWSAEQPQTEKKDPQSSYEPRSKPGDGQKFLERFVGEWDVVKTFYPRSGNPAKAEGACKQTMIHEGRFLQSDFVFEQNGQKTTGLGVIGYEPDTGKFTSVCTDSRSTRLSIRQSEAKFNGTEIVMFSKSIEGNDKRRSRTVTHLEDQGAKIIHRQFTAAEDGKGRLVMELVMTRKAEKRK
jgi:hypothetical protein